MIDSKSKPTPTQKTSKQDYLTLARELRKARKALALKEKEVTAFEKAKHTS